MDYAAEARMYVLTPGKTRARKNRRKEPMRKTKPDPTDVHAGSRVRSRRMQLGKSQEWLADQLGLTFQQVQKYEKGTNRMGSSRLQQIATAS